MRRRTHPRRQRNWPVVLAVITVLLVGLLIVPASSFSTARVDRGSTFNVVADSEASHNLDIASSVTVGQTTRLVTVTNNFGTDVTIDIQLRSDSTDKGDLVIDNVTVGDGSSFSLPAGGSQVVDITVASDSTLDGKEIYFHVNASASGLTANAPDRNVSVTA